MFKRNVYQVTPLTSILFVREGEGDQGGAGGSGGAGAGGAGSGEADIQAKIDAAVAQATQGLKAKNDELLGKLVQFKGIDPAKVKELMERLDQDEDSKLFAEGKKNVVIEKYTERMRAQHAADLAAAEERVKAEAARADAYRGSVLDNEIRAVTGGLHKGAIEDALLHARQIFTLDAKGKAVQLDSEGNPVLGKDGKNPFSPAEWIELQKELKPHWFPQSTSGSGSGDSRSGGSGTGKTIKRADFMALPPGKQAEIARSGAKIVD